MSSKLNADDRNKVTIDLKQQTTVASYDFGTVVFMSIHGANLSHSMLSASLIGLVKIIRATSDLTVVFESSRVII